MQNDSNDFRKRTAAQIKAILKHHSIVASVDNLGDGRTFRIELESNLKNRVALKKAGFLLQRGTEGDKSITIKTH